MKKENKSTKIPIYACTIGFVDGSAQLRIDAHQLLQYVIHINITAYVYNTKLAIVSEIKNKWAAVKRDLI